MKKYNTFLNETKEINEASIQDAQKHLQKNADTLMKMINGLHKGFSKKTVIKEMGAGYGGDFDSAISSLEDALMTIEEILQEIDIEISPR